MIGLLPEYLRVGDKQYPIRTDYRNILQAFEAFNDPELDTSEKWIVVIFLIFSDFSCAEDVEKASKNGFDIEEAVHQIIWFVSAGKNDKSNKKPELPAYDWEQDEQMIFSAINKVAKCADVREEEYIHWWTFLGYFNEIGEGTFSYILSLRNKLNRGKIKELTKGDKEFISHNKDMVILQRKLSKEEQEQEEEYQSLINEVLG
jgi:hypothetical protein